MALVGCSGNKEKIAMVDFDIIMEDFEAVQEMRQSRQQAEMRFQFVGDSLQRAFSAEGERLQEETRRLSKQKQDERAAEFQQRVMGAQQSIQRSYSEFLEAQQTKEDSLFNVIDKTIEDYAKQNELTLVLRSGKQGAVLYGPEEMDITEAVLGLLNEAGTEEEE